MSKLLKFGFVLTLLFSLFFASWFALNGEVLFTSDTARDFHLLREIDEKKIILIGARSSSGLFHGPLWLYTNYPAFILGNGNPVIIAWFWVLLCIIFVISSFFMARDLFGNKAALFYTVATSVIISFFANNLYSGGVIFLIPLFFYLFIKYGRTKKIKFLILNLIVGGIILQFQLAIGVPYLILSTAYNAYSILKSKNKKHLLAFLILPVLILNFVIFDLRHNFLYLNKLFDFLTPKVDGQVYNYAQMIPDRLNSAFNVNGILRHDSLGFMNALLFISIVALCITLIRKNKNRDVYFAYLYFYFGFFVLSFINKGPILYFYVFPIIPLTFLIICSYLDTKYKYYVLPALVIILALNINTAVNDIKNSHQFFGKSIYSWKFLRMSSDKIFAGSEKEFGYFVYSPDTVAYEGKYALAYAEKTHADKKAHYFIKKPITYLLIAPTPENKVVTGDAFWTKERLKIDKKPVETINFENGYKIEKYLLTDEEIKVPFDKDVDPGIHFR